MGRRKNPNFLPYEQAKTIAQMEGISSKSEYIRWKHQYDCREVPTCPAVVYATTGWESWTAFLNTNNSFPTKQHWWDYDKAWAYALKCGAKTKDEYLAMIHPLGVTKRPDIVYGKYGKGRNQGRFRGFNTWLGVSRKPLSVIESSRVLEKAKHTANKILFTAVDDHAPGIVVIQEAPSIKEAKRFCIQRGLRPYKAFKLDDAGMEKNDVEMTHWHDMVMRYCNAVVGKNIFNIDSECFRQLIFDLSMRYTSI